MSHIPRVDFLFQDKRASRPTGCLDSKKHDVFFPENRI